jgi:hypothetical protein
MSHAYSAAYFHCIFSTKERKDTIPDELRPKLWAYIEGTAKNLGIGSEELRTMRIFCSRSSRT